jgi:hypothetical protein
MAQTIASRLRLSKSWRPRSLPKLLAFAILCVGVLPLRAQSYENWTGWSNLGGSLATDRNPAVARNSDGKLEVFFAGSDNSMYHAKQVSAGSEAFETFAPIEDSRSGNPVMVRAGDNRLWVFVRDGNVLVYKFQQGAPGGEWSGWLPFPMSGGQLQGDPSVVVFQGRLHVFFRGLDNRLYYYAQWVAGDPAPRNWSGWVSLDGGMTANPAAVASDPNGRLEVFVRGTTGDIYTRSWTGSWSGWSLLGNNIGGSGAPAAARNDSTVEVVARGFDDRIRYINRSLGDGSWTGTWTSLNGPASSPNPTLAVNADGRMEIFMVGSDGNVYHNPQGAGGTISSFNSLGGFPGSGADIRVELNDDRRLQIFVRNGVNALEEKSQATPGGG